MRCYVFPCVGEYLQTNKSQAEIEIFGLKSGQLKTSSYLCPYLCLYEEICITSQNNWPDVLGWLGFPIDEEISPKNSLGKKT